MYSEICEMNSANSVSSVSTSFGSMLHVIHVHSAICYREQRSMPNPLLVSASEAVETAPLAAARRVGSAAAGAFAAAGAVCCASPACTRFT